MYPAYILGLLVAVFCVTGLCYPNPEKAPILEGQPGRMNSEFPSLYTDNVEFTLLLYKKLILENSKENILFSPLSISIASALLSLGARGTTQTQILEGLRFNLTETPEAEIHRGFQQLINSLNLSNNTVQLSTGNALFIDQSLELLDKFQEDSKSLYSSEVFPANFQNSDLATQQINDYVKKQTRGKIVKLFDRLDEDTLMILVNYIFFSAKWENPFNSFYTSKDKFFVSKDQTVEIPMMHKNKFYTGVFQDEELFCTVVELKYIGNATALFILPDENKMKNVEDALSPEVLKKWKNSLQIREINLFLPKFSISSSYELAKILAKMGMEEVFTNRANLSGITGQNNLKVSKVIHKAVMDVDEDGTEAAAVTGMFLVGSSLSWPLPPVIKFDRPFLVTLNNDRNILFMGKVINPQSDRALQ
ncbi:alpha-1-antichymotrypsin-like isoform X1 [Petaurus breviceps papuanus]|uniref:alpha-1-antichymotrypsin-like isoform X1 n=1 Tax=Petaurus breviceps papuanus TaxID=3040969 RepID=UPI0036DC9C28